MSNRITIIALVGLCIPSAASGNFLYSSGIFVQEYWQDEKLFYAVGNANDDELTINVLDDERKKLGGPWRIAAHSTATFNLDTPPEMKWVHFVRENGTSIGTLEGPLPPKFGKTMHGIVRTVNGLNGSGRRCVDVCVEQSAVAFKPGSVIEITIVLPDDNSVISFSRKEPPHPFPLPRKIARLELIDARSETLRIETGDDRIKTDVRRAIRKQPQHRLILRFRVPNVVSPQMLSISGWRQFAPTEGGHVIARGILVDPNLKRSRGRR